MSLVLFPSPPASCRWDDDWLARTRHAEIPLYERTVRRLSAADDTLKGDRERPNLAGQSALDGDEPRRGEVCAGPIDGV
jgi:hypothetical protein